MSGDVSHVIDTDVSAEQQTGQQGDAAQNPPKTQKVFSFNRDFRRTVPVSVHLPALYPGYAPFTFELRTALSETGQAQRESYLSLTSEEMTKKAPAQHLDEICDLLAADPTGFGDLATGNGDMRDPATKLRALYASVIERDKKEMLDAIIQVATQIYWGKVWPRECLQAAANSNS